MKDFFPNIKPDKDLPENAIPIFLPSADGSAQALTMKAVIEACYIMGKIPVLIQIDKFNPIPLTRTLGLQLYKKYAKNLKKVRGFMIDSDVRIEVNGEFLAEKIKEVDSKNYNVAIPYLSNNYTLNIFKNKPIPKGLSKIEREEFIINPTPVSMDEYKKMKDFDKIDSAGLGFYYGDIPLDYEFHFANFGKEAGEDILFFAENGIELRILKIPTSHIKAIPITLR